MPDPGGTGLAASSIKGRGNGSESRVAIPDLGSRKPGGISFGPTVRARRDALYLPASLTLMEWVKIGEKVCLLSNSSAWWLGDWLIYGQDKYPDRYRRAIAETMLDYQTLRNYAWIARKFPVSRRRDGLSFQHHLEVAALPAAQQDLWLDRALHFKWSKAELRRQVRMSLSPGDDCRDAQLAAVSVSVAVEQLERWRAAAELARSPLPEWLTQVADAAAAALLAGPGQ